MTTVDVVVPTVGRPSLRALLERLLPELPGLPGAVLVVDDRRDPTVPLDVGDAPGVTVVPGSAAGPAAARNTGWSRSEAEWVAFLDDDVLPDPGWVEALVADLAAAPPPLAGSQGRIRVPLPRHRRPTDWERNVAGLGSAAWITADMAYRRAVLAEVGGFDERFLRAYREDADLALRVRRAGYALVRGARATVHPVRPAGRWVSVRLQAGNADDARMRRLHGRGWREQVGAGRGRRRRHVATTTAASLAIGALTGGRPRLAAAAAATWAALTAGFAWERIAPGPRTPGEVATMAATSMAIPPAAVAWWVRGFLESRGVRPWAPGRGPGPAAAVLLDRDGTLVVDEPYNGDPAAVRPVPGSERAVALLHAAGVPTAVISNQSGIARGVLTAEEVAAVNRRVEELLGPLGPWFVCPHGPHDGCGCRKPAPGLVLEAARALGVAPADCVVIGDIGADVAAARAAGARAVLVPTPETRRAEVEAAPEVATDLEGAVRLALGSGA